MVFCYFDFPQENISGFKFNFQTKLNFIIFNLIFIFSSKILMTYVNVLNIEVSLKHLMVELIIFEGSNHQNIIQKLFKFYGF